MYYKGDHIPFKDAIIEELGVMQKHIDKERAAELTL